MLTRLCARALSKPDVIAVLEWLEQHEQSVRPSGEDDIVRMSASEFVSSGKIAIDSAGAYTAEAIATSLPGFFVSGRDLGHLRRMVVC